MDLSQGHNTVPPIRLEQPKELSSPIAANFCPTIFLAKIFIFMLLFYLLA